MTSHVLFSPQTGYRIYGPYKVSPSCALTDSIYSSGRQIMTYVALWNCNWDLSESTCRKSVSMWVGVEISDSRSWRGIAIYLPFFESSPKSPYHLILDDVFGFPPELLKIAWPRPLYTSLQDLTYQLRQSLTHKTCINSRLNSFSACSRKLPRSATCSPASRSPYHSSTSSVVLFYSCLILSFLIHHPKLTKTRDLLLDCSIQHPCVGPR